MTTTEKNELLAPIKEQYDVSISWSKNVRDEDCKVLAPIIDRTINLGLIYRKAKSEMVGEIAKLYHRKAYKAIEGMKSLNQLVIALTDCSPSSATEMINVATNFYDEDGELLPKYTFYDIENGEKITPIFNYTELRALVKESDGTINAMIDWALMMDYKFSRSQFLDRLEEINSKAIDVESTDITIESATESATEPATEPTTEPTTEPATESATEPATESATEPATEPATESATEPATESATESAIDLLAENTKLHEVINQLLEVYLKAENMSKKDFVNAIGQILTSIE